MSFSHCVVIEIFDNLVKSCSCGDDGRICGWRWKEITQSEVHIPLQGNCLVKLGHPDAFAHHFVL